MEKLNCDHQKTQNAHEIKKQKQRKLKRRGENKLPETKKIEAWGSSMDEMENERDWKPQDWIGLDSMRKS